MSKNSLKHIETFARLHGQEVHLLMAQSLLNSLQTEITNGSITKGDVYAKEIATVQDSLVKLVNALVDAAPGDKIQVEINQDRLNHYNKILKAAGLGFVPKIISAAIGEGAKLVAKKMFGKKAEPSPLSGTEDFAGLHGLCTFTKSEANKLGVIENDGLGFVGEKDIYRSINKQILKYIAEEKKLPWRQPWRDGYKVKGVTYGPQNYITSHPYHGANAFAIALTNWLNGTDYQYFLTRKQVKERGGQIKKGIEGINVWAYIKGEKEKKTRGGEVKIVEYSGVITYTVYPLEQTEGVKPVKRKSKMPAKDERVIVKAQVLVDNMPKPPVIKHDGGNSASYRPKIDSIHLPVKSAFNSIERYYSVLFHELIHSTGHSKRLNRGNDTRVRDGSVKDKKAYAFEELIAELGSAYLCGVSGIEYHTLKSSAAYLKGWASSLKTEIATDPTFFFRAVFGATRAAKYIIGTSLEKRGVPHQESPDKSISKHILEREKTKPPYATLLNQQSKLLNKILAGNGNISDYTQLKSLMRESYDRGDYGQPGSAAAESRYEDDLLKTKNLVKGKIKPAVKLKPTLQASKAKKGYNKKVVNENQLTMQLNGLQAVQTIAYKNHAIELIPWRNSKLFLARVRDDKKNVVMASKGPAGNKEKAYDWAKQAVDSTIIRKAKEPSGVMTISQARTGEFKLIGLVGAWLKLIGKACLPTSFLIYGPGGSGKSTLTILFAYYMSKLGYKICYVAGEQYNTPIFKDMLVRLNIEENGKFLIFRDLKAIDKEKYILGEFDLVAIDSKDSLKFEIEDFRANKIKYPKLSWLILSQGTKAGTFRGTEEWRNEVDTLIYCKNFIAYTNQDKNRWGGSAAIPIKNFLNNK